MKNIFKLSLLTGLLISAVNIAYAEAYFGANAGYNITTITKNVYYDAAKSSVYDKYNGVRLQALIGYNIRFSGNADVSSYSPRSYENDFSDRETLVPMETVSDYKKSSDEFYCALELNASYNSGQASENISPWFLSTSAKVTEQQRYNYDLFFLLKYRTQPNIILFLGPGGSRGLFNTFSGSTGGNLGITGDATTWLNGWGLKAGLEVPMSAFMNLVMTYQYTYYQDASFTRIEPLTQTNVTATYRPVLNSITIGFNWH